MTIKTFYVITKPTQTQINIESQIPIEESENNYIRGFQYLSNVNPGCRLFLESYYREERFNFSYIIQKTELPDWILIQINPFKIFLWYYL